VLIRVIRGEFLVLTLRNPREPNCKVTRRSWCGIYGYPGSQSTTLILIGQAKFYHKASPRPRALCKPALVGLEESGRFASESASRRISKRAAHRLGLAGRRGRRSSAFPGLLRRCTADACPEPGRRGVCKSAAIEYNWSTADTVITIERMAMSTLRSKVAAL
jgi:hypothetical protein